MGFLKRLLHNSLPDAVDAWVHVPYDGDTFPDGALAAVAIPGELEVELPPGPVTIHYRVYGEPKHWHVAKNWSLPAVNVEIMPVDPSTTPRIASVEVGTNPVRKVKAIGWSAMKLMEAQVAEPGGRYRITLTGPLQDDQAHLLFKAD